MAVYNTDFLIIKRAIESLLNQDFSNFELIIIDDGSHNETHHLLLDYVQKHEDKITYMRHSNRGQALSINRGVLNSTGDYITILDADDTYKPHHLSSCLKEMEHADLIASTTETIVDNETDYYIPDRYDQTKVAHVDNCILFATLFGKREVFVNLPFQNTYGKDALFYDEAALKYRVKKVDLRTYIYYRNSTTSICSKIKSKYSQIENKINSF